MTTTRLVAVGVYLLLAGCTGTVSDDPAAAIEVSEAPLESEQIIVMYKANPGLAIADARAQVEIAAKLRLKREIGGIHALVYQVDPGDTASEVVNRLQAAHGEKLEYAEIDTPASPASLPNDPLIASEWHLNTIAAPTAWDSVAGEGVTIAILDTGTQHSVRV